MTTILTFIIPALIVVLLSLPLVNVFKGKVTAKSAKMRLGTHICGFFGAVGLHSRKQHHRSKELTALEICLGRYGPKRNLVVLTDKGKVKQAEF